MAGLADIFGESYDPKVDDRPRPQHVPVKPKGELKPLDEEYYRNQPARETLSELARVLGNAIGFSPTKANQMGGDVSNWIDFVPVLGDMLGASEAKEDFQEGNYGKAALGAGLTALGVVPGVGDIAAKAGREGLETVADTMSTAVRAPPPTVGKRQAITANSLRQMPLDEAIAQARTGQHILPAGAGKKEGAFTGAPYAAQTMADIDMLRQKFDADVQAGSAGADWYDRAQQWIKEVAGPDPARQSELARNLALFSAQADPSGNLGFSVKARNNAIMGMTPVSGEGKEGVVRTGQQWDAYKKAYDTGEDIKLGAKTGVYADHMDPTRTSPTTGTNDIWHARALGYTEPEITGGLSPQKHAWMDAETVLAVDRANQAAIGGRTDWTPGEVQAAPWVAGKGRGLAESRKDMTVEQGVAEAAKTYPDYAPAFTAYGTHEMTPGRQTGHLPSIADADQATRDAFANEPGSWWQGPGGRDILYEAQGAYAAPSVAAHGVYGDPVQFNPMQAAKPLVAFSGPSGERVLDPASRQMMTGTEGFRAMMDAQDMGGFSIPIAGQKASHNNAFELNLPGGPTRANLAEIMADAARQQMPNTIHYGDNRGAVTNFEGVKGPIGAKQTKNMQQALGDRAKVTPTRLESGGVFLEDAWRGGAAKGQASIQGTDKVTNEMLSNLNAAQEAGLDKPEVRAKVLERFDRDARVALERGDVVRADLQKARELFAKGGFKLLRENLGKGLLPAAAIGLFLKEGASREEG